MEREGPAPQAWEGEVAATARDVGTHGVFPHLTPTLSAPEGGEGDLSVGAFSVPLRVHLEAGGAAGAAGGLDGGQ